MTFEKFCGSVFWDEYRTWNTTNPDFTPCFQKTVMVWVPCGFLWLFTPLQLRYISTYQRRVIPWTSLNILKIISSLVLILCSLFRLIHATLQLPEEQIYTVDYVYPTIEALSYLLVLILGLIHVRVGIHSSTLLLFFWILQTLTGAVRYRTLMLEALTERAISDMLSFVITVVEFPFVAVQLVLSCFADTVLRSKDEQNPYPVTYASPLSFITYSFFDGIAWKGFKQPLSKGDAWSLSEEYVCEDAFMVYERIEKAIETKINRNRTNADKKAAPLIRIMWQMIKWEFITGILVKYIGDLLGFVSPLMLRQLINFVSSDEPTWRGILYAIVLFCTSSTAMLCMNFHFYRMQSIGIKTRAAVMSAIYRKTLRMSSAAKRSSTVGEIVTLMSVDAQRIMDVWQYLGHAFSMPLQVAVCLTLLWNMLGVSVLVGFAIIILIIPVNGYVAKITTKYQAELMKHKDQRTKLMNEILGGMKILKLYAWELPFFDEVNKIRKKELVSLKKILLLNAFTMFFFQCAPFMISLSAFATFVLSDSSNILDAATAFVSLSLFDIIRIPLNLVPMVIAIVIQAHVSIKRIDNFMGKEDLDPHAVYYEYEGDPIVVKDGTFSWGSESPSILHNINLTVPDGQLLAVIGSVGAGKSSLISCLLGEMEKVRGHVNIRGSTAYIAQQAWIQNATVQSNITFGLRMDNQRYQKILDACALIPDLAILPGGDMTEIGEKGINLSGGQKQRVSLARAVYRNSDIYLLDDPLSAVDAHVGKHIFDNVIGPKGLLKKKTRILVTHGIAYLPYVDAIAVLVNGTISEIGSYKELLEAKGAFADFIMTYLNENEQLDEVEAAELLEIQDGLLRNMENENMKRRLSQRISRALSSDEEGSVKDVTSPIPRRRHRSVESLPKEKVDASKMTEGKLVKDEQMEIGQVNRSVYWNYIKAMGVVLSIAMIICLALAWSSSVGSNIWLSIWSNDQPLPDGTQNIPLRNLRLGIYGTFGIGQAIFALSGSLILACGAVRAARYLHDLMLMSILRSPMSFFDTTPLGRIVNRFSRDVDSTDYTVPSFFRATLDCFLQIIATIAAISLGTPIFLIAFIPLGIIFYFIQRLYIDASRQLKRLESVSRSPIYSHFSETIAGIVTVRAYRVQDAFINQLETRIDENHILYYPILTSKRWLGIRLEGVGGFIVLFASLFSVLSRETLDPGIVGLSISYSLSATFVLMWFVRNWCDLESNIVSVERMKEYSELTSEAEWKLEGLSPRLSWPDRGEVKFEEYATRYREGLDLVLKGISCDIGSREKVGIVGRTGAGKSSLTLSLFRLIEAVNGSITIDGQDISQMGLHDLRSRLTIIPQDPVLFCGTLRMNLDPFEMYEDKEIWDALEHSHLKEYVSGLPEGVDHEIAEGGENLSVGQRQLVCLARALLRKTKVLVLDEATAAVDLETDDLIQETIRKEFDDCTVITIAHRLNTIMESDRVMVLDQGLIKEFDTPAALLKNTESIFYSMAKDAGLA